MGARPQLDRGCSRDLCLEHSHECPVFPDQPAQSDATQSHRRVADLLWERPDLERFYARLEDEYERASFRITLLAPKNLVLREDHLLAGSALHREGFQDQRLNRQKLLVRFQLASLRRHRPPKQMQLASPD
jgi:hypothetical protein